MANHSKLPAVTARRWAYLAIHLGRSVVVAAGAGVSTHARASSGVTRAQAASLRPASHPEAFLVATQQRAGTWMLLPGVPVTTFPELTAQLRSRSAGCCGLPGSGRPLTSCRSWPAPAPPHIRPYLWCVPFEPMAFPAHALVACASTIRSST
jgi:hypothetical protein